MKSVITLLMLLISSIGLSQDEYSIYTPVERGEDVFSIVDKEPEFHGGYGAMMVFILENLEYPPHYRMEIPTTKSYASFVVETDGTISGLYIVKKGWQALDQELYRLISIMPRWEPGEFGGKVIRCEVFLPIQIEPR